MEWELISPFSSLRRHFILVSTLLSAREDRPWAGVVECGICSIFSTNTENLRTFTA